MIPAILLLLVLPAMADDPPESKSTQLWSSGAPKSTLVSRGLLDIQAVLGFSDTFKLGRWTPVTVTVNNLGSDIIGHLEVLTTAGDELKGQQYTMSHRRYLELTRDSRKRFRFTVLLESLSQPLVVRVMSGEQELGRRVIELRHRFTAGQVILVVSRDADLDYLNDSAGERLRVLYPLPEFLPDHWQGYDAVEAVVVHGVSLENLSARQFNALKYWVAHGGILAVSGGPDYALLRTPRLAELLPGIPVGMVQIADAGSLGEAFGSALDVSAPLHVNRLARFRGRALYHAGDIPLLIEEEMGRGRVLYLTFDVARYPFDRWSGMKQLWLNSLRIPPPESVSLRTVESGEENPVSAIVGEQSTGVPERTTVAVFLALYLGILATGYRLPSTKTAGRWFIPLVTWASPLVFAPAAYVAFGPLLFKKGATAVVVTVIEPLARTPYAHVRMDVAMYSNRTLPLQFEFVGPEPTFRPVVGTRHQATAANWVFREGARRSVEPDLSDKYVLHVLEGQDIVSYDLQVSVENTARGPRVQMRNDTGRTLNTTWLVFDGRAYTIGAIPEGATVERTFSRAADALRLDGDGWWRQLSTHVGLSDRERRATQAVLERKRLALGVGAYPGPDHALLIGFSTSPLRLAGVSGAWQRSELSLLLLRLPVASLSMDLDG